MRLAAYAMAFLLTTSVSAASAQPGAIAAAWTQLGPNDTVSARIIARGPCPSIDVDGRAMASRTRAAPNGDFPFGSCDLALPRNARDVSVSGRRIPLPRAHLRTIAVFGDSGCRIEIVFFQACNDPNKWPFPRIAQLIAQAHPDLVIDVGDYYYRETTCFVAGCSGSPHGDNWGAWSADFFAPAAPIFAAAPLLAVRGNHEDCTRGGLGWDRFLSVYPYGACAAHERPYETGTGGLHFFVLDSSAALDARPSRTQAPFFASDFAALRSTRERPLWLLTHRPMWGIDATLTGRTLPINRTMQSVEGNAATLPIDLVLSGHIHLFEALAFADRRAPQIIVGTGGDTLSNVPARVTGAEIDGTTVKDGAVRHGFGFALFHLEGKTIDVYDRLGARVLACDYGKSSVMCRRVSDGATIR